MNDCKMGARLDDVDSMNKPIQWCGVRHVQVLMIFLGMTLSIGIRASMSIAIVEMTNPNNENSFNWTIQTQSVILSSTTWGYFMIQIAAGELAAKFGGMTILVLSLGLTSALSMLLPLVAIYGNWKLVCVCRMLQGFMQGCMYPTVHYLIGKWVPLDERSRMSSFIFAGSQFGTACQHIGSGYIANYWGWPAIFYLHGATGLIWVVVYLIVGSDNPQNSKIISSEERFHIQSSLGHIGGHKRFKTPWKAILTSPPFLAAVAANIGLMWGYWTLLTEMPTYLSKVLQLDIKSNGVMSALPYITMFAMNFPIGFASDYAIKKKWVSVTACRKIFNSIGFFGPACILLCLSYIPAGNVTLGVFLLCLTLGFSAGYYNGFLVVFLDMAQNFSATLMGVSNFTGNFVSLFAPLFAGFVLNDETDPGEWRIIFTVAAMFYIITNLIFVFFGSSKEQEWNKGVEVSKNSINS